MLIRISLASFICLVSLENLQMLSVVTAVACDDSQVSLLMIFPRIQCHQFPMSISKIFFPLKQTLGFVFSALQTSAKTILVDLQNFLFIFMTFHIAMLLNKQLALQEVKYNSEWVLAMIKSLWNGSWIEVVINPTYNHVVICSNKIYSSYIIIFILYECIYVYINHF